MKSFLGISITNVIIILKQKGFHSLAKPGYCYNCRHEYFEWLIHFGFSLFSLSLSLPLYIQWQPTNQPDLPEKQESSPKTTNQLTTNKQNQKNNYFFPFSLLTTTTKNCLRSTKDHTTRSVIRHNEVNFSFWNNSMTHWHTRKHCTFYLLRGCCCCWYNGHVVVWSINKIIMMMMADGQAEWTKVRAIHTNESRFEYLTYFQKESISF